VDADVLLDGISTTNYEQNGGLLRVQYLPNPDAIEEFKYRPPISTPNSVSPAQPSSTW